MRMLHLVATCCSTKSEAAAGAGSEVGALRPELAEVGGRGAEELAEMWVYLSRVGLCTR